MRFKFLIETLLFLIRTHFERSQDKESSWLFVKKKKIIFLSLFIVYFFNKINLTGPVKIFKKTRTN
jgi:hypothetical protein